MRKKTAPTRRSASAKALASAIYRRKVVPSGKVYTRKGARYDD